MDNIAIWPATDYVTSKPTVERAVTEIRHELEERAKQLESENKLLEAHRLRQRTEYDLEMMQELGFCNGIENYSRILEGRAPGTHPFTLLDYFANDYVVFVDESHQTVPQIGGMYEGDRSRKQTLVDFGFRLPSALDNRPRSEEHTSELQSRFDLVCRLLLEKKKKHMNNIGKTHLYHMPECSVGVSSSRAVNLMLIGFSAGDLLTAAFLLISFVSIHTSFSPV